jgi:hypothetical protein
VSFIELSDAIILAWQVRAQETASEACCGSLTSTTGQMTSDSSRPVIHVLRREAAWFEACHLADDHYIGVVS